jgi:hypothetical protein
VVNVVIRRDLPTGKGERPSSHTPKPEDDKPRSWEVAWDSSRVKNPTNEDSSRNAHPSHLEKKETCLVQIDSVFGTGGRGEVEGNSKGFRSTATTEEGTQGRTRPTGEKKKKQVRRQGNHSRSKPHTHRSNRGVRRNFEHRNGMGGVYPPPNIRICFFLLRRYLVDPASSHMLVSEIKPCMSKYKLSYTAKLRMAH